MNRRKKRIILLIGALLFICGLRDSRQVLAENQSTINDFMGYYLCDIQEVGEYENPQVMELCLNNEGDFVRVDSLYMGTTGTTVRYDYTDIEIVGNTLTCCYEEAYGYYGQIEDIEPGSHRFILTEDGNLLEKNHVWYRYEKEVFQKEKEPGTLMTVADIDFPNGNYTGKASFLGNKNIQRRKVEEITFLDSLSEKNEQAWDVSVDGDGSVWAWANTVKGKYRVYIAAEGGVTANGSCDSLFRCCTSLKMIHFNGAFNTVNTGNMDSMFEECRSLKKIEGIERLDTSEVCFMYAMFAGCKKLQDLNLLNFDTSNVADMNRMFFGCSNLTKLDISQFDFSCVGSADLSDMFIGTKWEGSSPLLDGGKKDIRTSYILDTGTMMEKKPVLQAAVIQAYDKKIEELSQDGYKIFDTMYALKDLDKDGIPELLLKSYTSNGEKRGVYTFSVPICQVRLSMVENSRNEFSSAHFRYVIPQLIAYADVDIDTDGIEEEIDVAVSKDEKGYDYLAVYVDSVKCYDRQIKSEAVAGVEADISIYEIKNQNGLIYMHLYASAVEEYCGILRYDGDNFTEIASLKDLLDVSQLRNKGSNCYFEVQTEKKEISNSNIQIKFALEPFIWGDKLKFSMDYRYADNKLVQVRNLADIEQYEFSIFAGKRMELLDSVNGGEVNVILEEGEKVVPDKACLFNGKLWLNLKREDESAGWIKMVNAVFSEYGHVPKKKNYNEERTDSAIGKRDITNEEQVLLNALKEERDRFWYDYPDLYYTFCDINGDKQAELIAKGKAQNEYLFAVYVYGKADKTVKRIRDFNSNYENFYYSPRYEALVTFGRSSSHEVYTFYKIANNEIIEDFTISWYTDKVKRFYNYKKDGGDKLLKEVPFPEKDEKLWESYTGDLEELNFKQIES